MSNVYVEQDALIPAPPAVVYGVLADYRNGHNHIIPKPPFSEIEVVEGGIGAGTVIRFHTRTLGSVRQFEMRVSEPEPGRVLMERDVFSGLFTTFTVSPEGQHSRIRIRTEWDVRAGIAGRIEHALTSWLMRPIYAKELRLLAAYVAQTTVAS